MAAAVGYRFHPTDEELITHYLKLKMNGHDSLVDKVIPEVDVYRSEPSDLPTVMGSSSDDQVWYFYCRLDYKYKNSKRANRATESGFWKVTGKPRFIVARDTGEQIGVKKTLVFFYRARGDAKPVSTDWVIHQYQATTLRPDQVCLFV
ncbi:Protein NTM1-like 9 [Linum perenne]